LLFQIRYSQGNGHSRMTPKDAFYKVGTGIHRAIFNISKGRIFGRAFGMPLIELVTIGRRSGKVRATIAGSTRTMIARIATDEEKAELWPQIIPVFQGYARYQKRTERPIPVVILEPPR
jgi:F420H(2)-dependent quinone reductase